MFPAQTRKRPSSSITSEDSIKFDASASVWRIWKTKSSNERRQSETDEAIVGPAASATVHLTLSTRDMMMQSRCVMGLFSKDHSREFRKSALFDAIAMLKLKKIKRLIRTASVVVASTPLSPLHKQDRDL